MVSLNTGGGLECPPDVIQIQLVGILLAAWLHLQQDGFIAQVEAAKVAHLLRHYFNMLKKMYR
jgi:hypothetical protein